MNRNALCSLLLCIALAACGNSSKVNEAGYAQADFGTANRPTTIPALRAWASKSGTYDYTAAARIVADRSNAQLASAAAVLSEDLQALTGNTHTVVGASPRSGDIHLRLGSADSELGTEGYELKIGDTITITAPTATGVFYGTRTLLQLLTQGADLPAGIARDWPRYPERGLMLDSARQFFDARFIERHLRQMAYLKLNYLHLHFSDDQGFRIESDRFPEIVSPEHLTRVELAHLIEVARKYHVEIVPEIDMPGHFGAVLAAHPEYSLHNLAGQPATSQLDITNPDARNFARELIKEFLPLFPGRYWHIGGDEYMPRAQYLLYPQLGAYARETLGPDANEKDAIHAFENEMADLVKSLGKQPRMWHDDLLGGNLVKVNPEIVVEWWTDISPLGDIPSITPQALLENGHRVMNAGWFPNYYTTAIYTLPLQPSVPTAYEWWSNDAFCGPFVVNSTVALCPNRIAADDPRNLGGKLNVWTDTSMQTQQQIEAGIRPRLRVLTQKYWESPLLVPTYDAFLPLIEVVGDAPGFSEP